MIAVDLDLRDFERAARGLGAAADQYPFAIATAMNEAAKDARRGIIEQTWPRAVTVRSANFMRAALRTEFASKHDLTVTIYDSLGRGNLKMHATGGTKRPERADRIAVPTENVRRTSRGVAKSQRPKNLVRSFRRGDAIYQTYGPGGRKVRLMYVLRPAVRQPRDVPFYRDFAEFMMAGMAKHLPAAVSRAMRTRLPR